MQTANQQTIADKPAESTARTVTDSGPYYVTKSGEKRFYRDIGNQIALEFPGLKGEHIFKQVDALGMLKEFESSDSPHSLPYSFSQYADFQELPQPYEFTEEELEKTGRALVDAFRIPTAKKKGRFQLSDVWGDRTLRGVALVARRIIAERGEG